MTAVRRVVMTEMYRHRRDQIGRWRAESAILLGGHGAPSQGALSADRGPAGGIPRESWHRSGSFQSVPR